MHILKQINIINTTLTPKQKENEDSKRKEKIKVKLEDIDRKIKGYKTAYDYYIEKESIVLDDEVIPPTMAKKTESKLASKKQEKQQKQQKVNDLKKDIRLQDETRDKLDSVLGISKQTIKKEEN